MRDEATHQGAGVTAPADHDTPSASSSSPATPASRGWLSSVRRPRTSPAPKASGSAVKRTLLAEDDARRDSALAPSNSTSTSSTGPNHAPSTPNSVHKTPSLPAIVVQDAPLCSSADHLSQHWGDEHGDAFQGLDTIIPTGDFDDLTSPNQVSFSKRGSMLLGGKRVNRMNKQLGLVWDGVSASPRTPVCRKEKGQHEHPEQSTQPKDAQNELSASASPHPSARSPSRYSGRARSASNRVLSADEMMLSRRVRAMYRHGNESAVDWDGIEEESGSVPNGFAENSSVAGTPVNSSSLTVDRHLEDSSSIVSSRRASTIAKEPTETAGGLEDWADMEDGEVDRYGFIVPKKTVSRGSSNGNLDAPENPRIHRVSTALLLASEEPRKRGMGRSASKARTPRSKTGSPKRRRSQKSLRATGSVLTSQTARSTPQKSFRQAANRLPQNRDRRLVDEASDMLKLPPGLAEIAEKKEGGKAAQAMKAKEMEREEKWRKMAKVVQSGAQSGGMIFEFDTKDPKVISRTWKGIPDRWRATAWHAFLAASAKATKDSPTDEELIESFYELQEESSADDLQIDVDVPRTISRHIMFRRRYRGGQRLLFRVLHAMSLYLPDTGYVQGMAALAATLLCYYEEDRAFVMLVRLWMLRGLERLYESGFAGLMDALEDFEKNWLQGGDIARQLEELNITSTAYGTRWYLTLFNYSLPFAAQLRVWDVFMLLGDASYSNSPNSKFVGDLDVLHATSAALIDATREILLDSDFENAMKVLTSWIPIKDEDLLMKVARTEYKMRKKRAHAG
ncbi:rab-GTPase-TBC domain-containing protein [Massariosphaeria phaeospora]|uniref:Rab-GTPase-TBC domain-containing protein n=1 Tax=Massariosphaeria phaeospora TaxID=100035 RepID=A0A7C8IJI5_9PLEO|nr:rab-GTPase-TBC domain-containing protein [Massariosphaeria phaeospora]